MASDVNVRETAGRGGDTEDTGYLMLRAAGASPDQIDQMLVHTPCAIFERQGRY